MPLARAEEREREIGRRQLLSKAKAQQVLFWEEERREVLAEHRQDGNDALGVRERERDPKSWYSLMRHSSSSSLLPGVIALPEISRKDPQGKKSRKDEKILSLPNRESAFGTRYPGAIDRHAR